MSLICLLLIGLTAVVIVTEKEFLSAKQAELIPVQIDETTEPINRN